MKYTIFIFLFIFSIFITSITAAQTIYSGETKVIDLSSDFDRINYWNMTGNTTNLSCYVFNDNQFSISIPVDYEPGQLILHFEGVKDGEERVVNVDSGSSGGGGGGGGYSRPPAKKNNTNVNQTVITPIVENQTGQNNTIPEKVTITEYKSPPWVLVPVIISAILIIVLLSLLALWMKNKSEWKEIK